MRASWGFLYDSSLVEFIFSCLIVPGSCVHTHILFISDRLILLVQKGYRRKSLAQLRGRWMPSRSCTSTPIPPLFRDCHNLQSSCPHRAPGPRPWFYTFFTFFLHPQSACLFFDPIRNFSKVRVCEPQPPMPEMQASKTKLSIHFPQMSL